MTTKFSPPADIVLLGGKVITVNPQDQIVEAMAIKGNRIAAVGSRAEIETFIGSQTRVYDLQGRSAMPGFIDDHIHMTSAHKYSWLALGPESVSSIEEIKVLVAERAKETPSGEWILGSRYHPEYLEEGRHPTRYDLDLVAPNHPVALEHRAHCTWTFNTVALQRIGVDKDTIDPPGCPIERDENGIPLGPMGANCRTIFVEPNIPKVTQDEVVEGYRRVCKELNRHGVTTAFEASLRRQEELLAWRRLREEGDLTLRVYLSPYPVYGPDWEKDSSATKMFDAGLHTGFGDEWIKLGSLTYGVDGDPMVWQEALLEPFSNNPTGDPEYRGTFRVSKEVADDFCMKAHANGWQISAVCVGDAGVTMAIDAIEKAQAAYPGRHMRHRLEHAQLWNESLLERAGKLGIVWNATLALGVAMGRWATLDAWGPRSRYSYPVKSALEHGIMVSGGSDWSVNDMNPMIGIHALVTRRLEPLKDGHVLAPEEAVSVLEAIRIHTYNGAYTAFEEDSKGSLEVGKLADVAVLSEDILSVPVDRLRDVSVVLTILDGKVVYEAASSQ